MSTNKNTQESTTTEKEKLPKQTGKKQLSDLCESAVTTRVEITTNVIKTIPENQISETIGLTREKYKLPDDESALVGICLILQSGGCNSSKTTNIALEVNSTKLESKVIAGFIRSSCKNASPRMFARQLGLTIFKISKVYKIPGNLKVRLEKLYPKEWNSITDEDKEYWASDFQSSTTECPDGIKFLIRQNYNDTFNKSKVKP